MDDIIIFQHAGPVNPKINGILKFGRNLSISRIIELPATLPDFIEDPEDFFQEDFSADLVISFLKHPDLLDYLVLLCQKKKIPVIASGQKHKDAITPFTCCSLGPIPGLGNYGEQFGIPEYQIVLEQESRKIKKIFVRRGASCGATWLVTSKLIGLTVDDALECVAREVQYLCSADPSNFDPISDKSSLHVAGNVHAKALRRAIESLKKN